MDSTNNVSPFPENGINCEYIQGNLFHLVYGKMTDEQMDIIIGHIKDCAPCRNLFATEYEFRNIFCSMSDDCKICPESVKSRLELFLGDPNIHTVADAECTEEDILVMPIDALDRLSMGGKISHRTRLLAILKDELSAFTKDQETDKKS